LQGSGSSISQTVDVPAAGTYVVSFQAAQRPGNAQTFEVEVDGAVVGTITPSGSQFASYATGPFTVTAGSHTIQFVGLNPQGGDNTAFLDQIRSSQSAQSAIIGTAFASPLVVVVTDAYGNVEPGVSVTFAAPASGATAALSSSTVVTDGNGRASVTATAGTTIGHYTVTASAAGTSSASFSLTNAEVPSLVVNTTQDVVDNADGLTSLREAIAYADSLSGPATITFDPTVFSTPQTITLTGGQLELSNTSGTETILGPGAG
jgi:hypothetical protein